MKGVFPIEIKRTQRDTLCSFFAIERLERSVFKRPIMAVLNEAINGGIYFHEVLDTILVGLSANKDTRFTRDEIGEEMASKGVLAYTEWYIRFLTFAVTGETEVKPEYVTDDDKKK